MTLRKIETWIVAAALLLIAPVAVLAEQKTQTWTSTPQTWFEDASISAPNDPSRWFASDGSLDASRILNVIDKTMGRCVGVPATATDPAVLKPCDGAQKPVFPGDKDYVLIHVIRWKSQKGADKILDIDHEHWYVANGAAAWDDTAAAGTRIFGSRSVYLLYLYLNTPASAGFDVTYRVLSVKKTPAYLSHLSALLTLYSGLNAQGANNLVGKKTIAQFNSTKLDVAYVPSDMKVSALITPSSDGGPVSSQQQTFDNEGKYHIDFSIGYPVKKAKDVAWVETSSSLAPADVSKANLMALFNYYPQAFDIKTTPFSWIPHAVVGMGLSKQPLHEVLFGVGIGPLVAHIYAGVLLNTIQLPTGAKCGTALVQTTTLAWKTCPEFSIGLNVAVGAIADALKKSSASSADNPADKPKK